MKNFYKFVIFARLIQAITFSVRKSIIVIKIAFAK